MEDEAQARKRVVAGKEREKLTPETLGMQKWRGNDAKADCDMPKEEKTT